MYQHLQVSFYFWAQCHGPKFSAAPLVLHYTAVSRYPQHDAHLPPAPLHVFLHTHEWPLRLQRYTYGTDWNQNISLRNYPETKNLGSTWCRCLVYWLLPRPLPLSQDIHTSYPGRKNCPHCFLFTSWIFSPSQQSPGQCSPLHLWSDYCNPTPLPAHPLATCRR